MHERSDSESQRFENIEIFKMSEEQRKEICYKNISMILQDSINSLNPYEKIKKQLLEGNKEFKAFYQERCGLAWLQMG